MKSRLILAAASSAILAACLQDSEKFNTQPLGPPELVHSGLKDSLWPGESVAESVYVKNAPVGSWKLYLIEGPTGAGLEGNSIKYWPPAGQPGPHPIRVRAVKDTLVLRAEWEVVYRAAANLPPILTVGPHLDWVVVGQTIRIAVQGTDPEGQPLRYDGSFPAGAKFEDSAIVWTPTSDQVGTRTFRPEAYDSHGVGVYAQFSIEVKRNDPRPYAPRLTVGRTWWFKGFEATGWIGGGAKDSTYMRRRINVAEADTTTRTLTLRVRDTLTGTVKGERDTTYHCAFPFGKDFDCGGTFTGPQPFGWQGNAPISEDTSMVVGGISLSGKRDLIPSTCEPGTTTAKYGCSRISRIYVRDWGMINSSVSSTSAFSNSWGRMEYEAWELSAP